MKIGGNNSGFTLIETIVAGILTTVLAGAGTTLFLVYSSESRDLAAHIALQVQYDNIAEQIGLRIRNGDMLQAGTTQLPGGRTKSVRVIQNGVQTYAFSIGHPDQADSTYLYESKAGNTPTPYRSGPKQVKLVAASFTLNSGTDLTMTLQLTDGRTTVPPRTERFRCRN